MFFGRKKSQNALYVPKKLYLCTVKQKDNNRSLILGYGVMVTQQILVLFFLVRIRVAQLHFAAFSRRRQSVLGYGVMVTQQILVLFFLVRIRVAQLKRCSE